MAIWLKKAPLNSERIALALDNCLLRREDWAQVGTLHDTAVALEREKMAIIEQAGVQAKKLVDDAQHQAQKIVAEAGKQVELMREEGHRKGLEQALKEWNDSILAEAGASRSALLKQRERIARLVMRSVEKVIHHQDPDIVYQLALQFVSRDIHSLKFVTLRVAPDDLMSAQQVFEREVHGHPELKRIQIEADDDLQIGDCVMESDQGIVSLGLDSQISTIKSLVESWTDAAAQKE